MSEWTVDTLKEHIMGLRDGDLRAIAAASAAAERADTKADTALEKRLDGVNEFRATLADQAKQLASRVEVEALEKRVGELADRFNKTEGRAVGLNAGWVYLIGAAGIVIAAVTLISTFFLN